MIAFYEAFAPLILHMSIYMRAFQRGSDHLLQSNRCTENRMDRLPTLTVLLLGRESMNKYSKALFLHF